MCQCTRCFPAVGGAQRENWLPAAGYPRPCYQIGLDGKSRTVLALGDKLHAFVTPGSWTEGYREARLYRARIGTNVWQRAGWAFTKGTPYRLLTPGLLQAGRDHADLGGGYVYAYATRYAPSRPESDGHSVQRGPNGGEIMLLRAPRGGDLLSKAVWRLFAGLDGAGRPTWTADPARMRPVIVDRNGVG